MEKLRFVRYFNFVFLLKTLQCEVELNDINRKYRFDFRKNACSTIIRNLSLA